MSFETEARPGRRSRRKSWPAVASGAVAVAAAVLATAPATTQPVLRSAPDVPVEVPIPGGFQGFPEILRFVPPAPPVPQMPLGRAVPHRDAAAARTA